MAQTRSTPPAPALALLLGAAASCVAPPDGPQAPPAPPAPLDMALGAEPLHRHRAVSLGPAPDAPGELLGQELGDGAPFTELLPSWNAPAGARFLVDVRVAAADGPWSPWLRIGDWNVAGRAGEVTTTFDRGRVAVDVLELTVPMERAQLRFRPEEGAAPLDPARVRAHVVLSDLGALPAALARAAAEPWPAPVALEVPARSQRADGGDIGHRICSPTSVAMVASFHGTDVPTRTMAATLLDPHHDIYGNWNRAVQGARAHGVAGRLARLSSWEAVAALLAEGTPIIASIRAREGELEGAPYPRTGGHLLVVRGLDAGGRVLVNDPAARRPEGVPRSYARADMETVWFANGGVAYLLEGPAVPAAGGSAR